MKKLSFKAAASKILSRTENPMTAAEITKIAIEEDLIDSSGKTPEATMAAQIYVDINKDKNSEFRKVGRGLFTLKRKSDKPNTPELIVESQNELTSQRLKEQLHSMDPFQFEYLAADLLQKIGYENVTVTKRSGDKGIDVVANLTVGGITNVKTVIQVKRYAVTNKISGAVITQLRGSAEVDQRGLVITTSDFTKDAIEESQAPNKMPVSLVNGSKLIELLIKHGVGIKKQELTVLSIDEEYFKNSSSEEMGSAEKEKNRAIWPLPGGINNYIETLNSFLEQIEKGNNTKKGLSKWYLTTFESVSSESTIQSYINVPKNMGLIRFENGVYQFTDDGRKYFKSKDNEFLYEIISSHILAFDDVYEYINSLARPVNEEEILNYLRDSFDIEWTTYAQVNFRLLWLMNLNKVFRKDNGYVV
ncbi:restriction endonuclease [Oscillatoria amoena NRMC-F 0135]|nr:restriction endonuclease [Oscillatoria amoena NRMC-F 0135]